MPITTMEFASRVDEGAALKCGKGSPKWPLSHTEYKRFPVTPHSYSLLHRHELIISHLLLNDLH